MWLLNNVDCGGILFHFIADVIDWIGCVNTARHYKDGWAETAQG